MKAITAAATAIALTFGMCGFYVAFADTPQTHERVVFANVDDGAERHGAQLTIKRDGGLPEITVQGQQDAQEQPEETVDYPEPDYYEPEPYSGPETINGDGFMQQGVREFEGRTETWYSSNATRHMDTDQWTADEEGYYRDSDGNYVVAASDMEQGATFETSKGTAKVYDSGCENGVTDFYTAF